MLKCQQHLMSRINFSLSWAEHEKSSITSRPGNMERKVSWGHQDSTDWSSMLYHLTHIWAATRENRSSGFPTRSDTNRAVQAQKRARSLKFRIYVEEELYYPSSKNKGADQLRGYREADLRLCFRLGKNPVFSRCGSYDEWTFPLLSFGWVHFHF